LRAVKVTTACLQVDAERRAADLRGQLGGGLGAAGRAAQPVRAMLGHHDSDRRQLRELVTSEATRRPAFVGHELAPTAAANIRIVIDDLIELVLRPELAARALMPRLPTRLALAAQQLLGLRPGLRPPLLTRLGRIA
jgi:hypothetical protein